MKLHLGCGQRYLDGYTHVDLAEFEHIDYRVSIDKLEMFESGSIDEIYCSHAFEYFDRHKSASVLEEWKRVLKFGGKLMLVVPDFDQLIKIYLKTESLTSILGPLFGKWHLNESVIYHKTVWNELDLKFALKNAGFHSIERFNPITFLSSINKSYDDHSLAFFPHMDRTGLAVSLALSASATK